MPVLRSSVISRQERSTSARHSVGRSSFRLDAQDPIVLLAGIHVGCFELFGTDRIRASGNLKGKTVAVWALQSVGHVFVSAMAAHVGLDPRKDIAWAVHSPEEANASWRRGRWMPTWPFPLTLRSCARTGSATSS